MLTIWRKENIVQKHKWYNEIVAWASGAIIESKDVATGVWEEVDPYWETDDEYEYRIAGRRTLRKPGVRARRRDFR